MRAVSRCGHWVFTVWSLASAAAGWAAPQVAGSVVLTSDYVFEGLSLTCGDPALQADLHLVHLGVRPGTELFAGAWGSAGLGNGPCGRSREINLYAGLSLATSAESKASLSYVRYLYPGGSYALSAGCRYDFDELNATWSLQDRLHLSAAWSPDAQGYCGAKERDRGAWAAGIQLRQPIGTAFSLNGGAGYDAINDPQGTGYGFWSVGAGYAVARAQLELLYVHAAPRARRLFDSDVAGSRVAATVLWRF